MAAFRAWCLHVEEGQAFMSRYLLQLDLYKFSTLLFTTELMHRLCDPSDHTRVVRSRWLDMVGPDQTPSSALCTLMNEVMLRGPLCV